MGRILFLLLFLSISILAGRNVLSGEKALSSCHIVYTEIIVETGPQLEEALQNYQVIRPGLEEICRRYGGNELKPLQGEARKTFDGGWRLGEEECVATLPILLADNNRSQTRTSEILNAR